MNAHLIDAKLSGGCQCGAVRYEIDGTPPSYCCHCTECQKQAASAFGISVPVYLAQLQITGKTGVWRRPTDSGAHTNCHFCETCGTRIYHAGDNRPGLVTIKGGTLDDTSSLKPLAHIWVSSKQEWLQLSDHAPQWETQPQNIAEWANLFAGNR